MRINLASVLVDDQEKALRFYTEVLGFLKKHDVPLGEARWLTVVSPDAPDGTELLLEPDGHPAAKPFKQALVSSTTASPTRRSPSPTSRPSSTG
jgi:catechol 2,3-dioxygenase-like lactoylglutathione lyase family enzyme